MNTDRTLFDPVPDLVPIQPYGGSSGWSGSETSKARAEENDRSGRTKQNQTTTLNHLFMANFEGLTWRDLAERTGWHHGTASGALSTLHKAGLIERLEETRHRCAVYVLPDYVRNRSVAPYRPNASARRLEDLLAALEDDLLHGRTDVAIARIRSTRAGMADN